MSQMPWLKSIRKKKIWRGYKMKLSFIALKEIGVLGLIWYFYYICIEKKSWNKFRKNMRMDNGEKNSS